MAKFTKKQFIEGLKEMTLLEVNELVEAMREEFRVDPSAVVVAQTATTETADEGPSTADVILTAAGSSKLAVIKIIREVTGLGLKNAEEMADNGGAVKENLNMTEANELKVKLEEAGATVELK